MAAMLASGGVLANAVSVAANTSPPSIREQRHIRVGEKDETWRLVWESKPSTVCGPDEIDMAITCPCSGWAYGQYGELALVRLRDGREVDPLQLAPLFGQFDYPGAEVQGYGLCRTLANEGGRLGKRGTG